MHGASSLVMGLEVWVWCAVMEFGWALQALDGNGAVFSKGVACKRTRLYYTRPPHGSSVAAPSIGLGGVLGRFDQQKWAKRGENSGFYLLRFLRFCA